jgi:regulator of protease activity HflC (stomatin/prohibitin superfamily)
MILLVLIVIVVVGFAFLAASVRVLREYERGVVFRLGRLMGEKGPGLTLLIPFIDQMVKVSLRTVALNIPPQEVITRDNVPARVNAVAYFAVVGPNDSVNKVEDFLQATSQIAQTTLRSVLGKAELDTLLSERERLNEDLQKIIDDQTEPWGVKVSIVEIKDVEIPQQMQRAMARQAEAERERRAKVINAEGEYQASERLSQAADVISQNPATLQLRYLQTLGEIGVNQNSTVVFPLPIDLIRPFLEGFGDGGDAAKRPPRPAVPSQPEVSLDPGPAAVGPSGVGALGSGAAPPDAVPPREAEPSAAPPAPADPEAEPGTPPSPSELPPSRR